MTVGFNRHNNAAPSATTAKRKPRRRKKPAAAGSGNPQSDGPDQLAAIKHARALVCEQELIEAERVGDLKTIRAELQRRRKDLLLLIDEPAKLPLFESAAKAE